MSIPEWMLTEAQRTALARRNAGEPVSFSTGIDGYLTYGYGEVDDYGYFQYPLRWEFLTPEQHAMVTEQDARTRRAHRWREPGW